MKFRWMRVLPLIVIVCIGGAQIDGYAQSPGAVVVDRAMDSTWRKLYEIRQFECLKILDAKDAATSRAQYEKRTPIYHNAPGFQKQLGYVYSLNEQAVLQKMLFVTVSGQNVFDRLATDKIQKMQAQLPQGQELHVTQTANHLQIAAAPLPETRVQGPNGSIVRVSRSLNPVNLRYDNDGYIFGADSVGDAKVDFSKHEFRRLLARAKDKTRFISIRPKEFPREVRSRVIESLEQNVRYRLQKRDLEQKAEYSHRRTKGEELLSILNSLAFEVDSATAWTKWPNSRNEPFTGRAELIPKPNTDLEKFTKSLKSLPNIPQQRNAIVTVNANMQLNKRVSALLMILNDSAGWPNALKQTINVLLQGRKLNVRVDLVNQDGEPGVVATSRLEETIRQNLAPAVVELTTAGIAMEFEKNELRFTNLVAVPERNQSSTENESSLSRRMPSGTILSLRADLKSLVTEDPNTDGRRLAKLLESMLMEHWKYRNLSPQNRARQRYPPMWKYGDPRGDWTLKLNLRVVNGNLIADCRVGYDLFSWFKIRML